MLRLIWAGMLVFRCSQAWSGDWPAFRGPDGDGVAKNDKAPIVWGPDKNIRWKTSLPGPGNSSPIVSTGRVFVTCAEDKGRKRNLFCFDRTTGRQLWVRTTEFPEVEPTHHSNPYCASTPVADGKRVVVWHGSAGIYCYDLEGKELWRKDLGQVHHEWGYASSPILYRGKVILSFGPGSQTFLCALDLNTGTVLWQHKEPGGLDTTEKRMVGSWSTPIVHRDAAQILCTMPTRLVAIHPDNGRLLWSCAGLGAEKVDLVYASPVVCGDMVVAFTGWVQGPTIGCKLGGSGDVTATHRVWLEKQPQRIGSGIVDGQNVYIVNAGPGTAQCIDCETGKIRWTERLEGGESWGSIVSASGRMYITSRRGITTVFRANSEKLEVLAMNDLQEPSNATAAISDGEIFLRTDKHLYCVAER